MPAALGSPPAGPKPRPMHLGGFPEGRRSRASLPKAGRPEPSHSRPGAGARRGLHSPHLHGAASRQAVEAFETLHYHVLPRWLHHPTLHGGSLADHGRLGNRAHSRVRAGSTSRRSAPPPRDAGSRSEDECEEGAPSSSLSLQFVLRFQVSPSPSTPQRNKWAVKSSIPSPLASAARQKEGRVSSAHLRPACHPGPGATWDIR